MSILVKNSTTGAEVKIFNVKQEDGVIRAEKQCPDPKNRFYARYFMLSPDDMQEYDGTQVRTFRLSPEWEVVTKSRGRKTAADTGENVAKAVTTTPQENAPQTGGKVAKTPNVEKVQGVSEKEGNTTIDETARLMAQALAGLRVQGTLNADEVRKIMHEELQAMAQDNAPQVAKIIAKVQGENEYRCAEYDDILQDVADGYYPYLWGAAGSGKSHTAEQIARDLGLTFYGQTTIQFAYDVKGYGDAGGKFVDTPFFKAFADEAHGGKGGLYFQDEYDRSYPEAAVVLNTALSNGYYDFPVIGRVEMHPNFRFMAAGNTNLKGASDGYVAANELDASSRDRLVCYECGYNHEVELNAIAKGDAKLVGFVEDLRNAIKKSGIQHIVSYRATAYMENRKDGDKTKVLSRKTLAGLNTDQIRLIYGYLTVTSNEWAVAMYELVK